MCEEMSTGSVSVSFPILVSFGFSFFFFPSLARSLLILFIFSSNNIFVSLIFYIVCFCFQFHFINFCSFIILSFSCLLWVYFVGVFLFYFCFVFVFSSWEESLDYGMDLRLCLFSNENIQFHKFLSQNCYICDLYVLILYFYFQSVQCSFSTSLETSFLNHRLFRGVLLSIQMFANFLPFFCYWLLIWFHCGQRRPDILF